MLSWHTIPACCESTQFPFAMTANQVLLFWQSTHFFHDSDQMACTRIVFDPYTCYEDKCETTRANLVWGIHFPKKKRQIVFGIEYSVPYPYFFHMDIQVWWESGYITLLWYPTEKHSLLFYNICLSLLYLCGYYLHCALSYCQESSPENYYSNFGGLTCLRKYCCTIASRDQIQYQQHHLLWKWPICVLMISCGMEIMHHTGNDLNVHYEQNTLCRNWP